MDNSKRGLSLDEKQMLMLNLDCSDCSSFFESSPTSNLESTSLDLDVDNPEYRRERLFKELDLSSIAASEGDKSFSSLMFDSTNHDAASVCSGYYSTIFTGKTNSWKVEDIGKSRSQISSGRGHESSEMSVLTSSTADENLPFESSVSNYASKSYDSATVDTESEDIISSSRENKLYDSESDNLTVTLLDYSETSGNDGDEESIFSSSIESVTCDTTICSNDEVSDGSDTSNSDSATLSSTSSDTDNTSISDNSILNSSSSYSLLDESY